MKKRLKTYPIYYNCSAHLPEDVNDKTMLVKVKYCLFDRLFTLVTQTLESENVSISLN